MQNSGRTARPQQSVPNLREPRQEPQPFPAYLQSQTNAPQEPRTRNKGSNTSHNHRRAPSIPIQIPIPSPPIPQGPTMVSKTTLLNCDVPNNFDCL